MSQSHHSVCPVLSSRSHAYADRAFPCSPFPIHDGHIQQSPEPVDVCVSIDIFCVFDDLVTAVPVKAIFSETRSLSEIRMDVG